MRKKNVMKKKEKKKKKKRRKSAQKAARWATAHLSHGTMDCIVTQGWGGWSRRRGLGHNTAITRRHDQKAYNTAETMAYDTADLRAGLVIACARMAWPRGVAIQSCNVVGGVAL